MSINKSDLAASGRWIRDHFSNWFASSFVMAAWFVVIVVVIFVDFTMGGEYMERWSPKPELNFRFKLLGYAMAGAPIAIMAAGFMARRNGMLKAGTLAIAFAVLLSLFSIAQSVGTMSLTAENMTVQAEAFEKVETTDASRLDFLKAERDEIISTRNSEIQRIEDSIDAIRNDGVAGIPRRDQDSIDLYNERIDRLRNDASEKIAAVGDEIKAELETPSDVETIAAVAPMKFDPMVVVINWFTSLGKPTELSQRWITIIYLTAIAIVICLIGQTLSLFLSITARRSADARVSADASERAKKGWETRKEKEEAEREQLKIGDHGYWSNQILKALNNNMPRRTVKGMCNTFFGRMDEGALKVQLERRMDERMELPKAFYKNGKGEVKRLDRAIERGFLSDERPTYLMQDHIDYILMKGEYAPKKEAKPKQEPNGGDHSTELTVPELGADDADRPTA